MGLFKKKPKETSSTDFDKQIEELQKQKDAADKKTKEIEEIRGEEEVKDFVTDDIPIEGEDKLLNVMQTYVDSNGLDETIDYLSSLLNQLRKEQTKAIIQDMMEEDVPDTEEKPELEG